MKPLVNELIVVIDGGPSVGKRDILQRISRLLPNARIVKDIDANRILFGRGLLECQNPCCFNRVQSEFIRKRLQRDLQLPPRPGVTVQIRDVFSCDSFDNPFRLFVCNNLGSKDIPNFHFASHKFDQKRAEKRVRLHRARAKRLSVALRVRKSEAFIAKHNPKLRTALKEEADCFVKLLNLHQMIEADKVIPILHDPAKAAQCIVDYIRRECLKLKISI